MPDFKNRPHFDDYKWQTQVKHLVIEKYLKPYYRILRFNGKLLYIDAFAGPGYYDSDGDKFPGSPIRALKLLRDHKDIRDIVKCLFSEPDDKLFDELRESINEFCSAHDKVEYPILQNLTFSDLFTALRGRFGPDLKGLAPGFLLVDPCGVSGVAMADIGVFLQKTYSEIFLFFNSSGFSRVLGANLHASAKELLGDSELATIAIELQNADIDIKSKTNQILNLYTKQLRLYGAEFVCPFRIEYQDRRATSHYLIHACKHKRGFCIMKDIMWGLGSGTGLELLQKSEELQAQLGLFPSNDTLKEDIIKAVRSSPRSVQWFKEECAGLPDNYFAPDQYRKKLIELEAAGCIDVFRDGMPAPVETRRKIRGNPTLAPDCEVRLTPA